MRHGRRQDGAHGENPRPGHTSDGAATRALPSGRDMQWRRRLRTGARLVVVGALCGLGLRSAHQSIERTTRDTIRTALDATGHGWVDLDVSGRRTTLFGSAPSASAGDSAVVVAGRTMCSGLLRERRCSSRVFGRFGSVEAAWPELRATTHRGVVTLAGVVPDEATHWAVLDRAQGAVRLGKIRRVVDEMTLTGRAAPAGVDATAAIVGEAAALCESGGATLSGGVLSVDCQVSESLVAALRELVGAPLSAGYLGEVRLTVTADRSAEDG